ncbi:MAG: hypothetical protein NT038_07950 [Euryarchaeota archaeon]|nr:hypothetical protein [Euryarchaeota archaeon]
MFKLTIRTDNQAFDENPQEEVIHILKDAILKLEQGNTKQGILLDSNGNLVGNYTLNKR